MRSGWCRCPDHARFGRAAISQNCVATKPYLTFEVLWTFCWSVGFMMNRFNHRHFGGQTLTFAGSHKRKIGWWLARKK